MAGRHRDGPMGAARYVRGEVGDARFTRRLHGDGRVREGERRHAREHDDPRVSAALRIPLTDVARHTASIIPRPGHAEGKRKWERARPCTRDRHRPPRRDPSARGRGAHPALSLHARLSRVYRRAPDDGRSARVPVGRAAQPRRLRAVPAVSAPRRRRRLPFPRPDPGEGVRPSKQAIARFRHSAAR